MLRSLNRRLVGPGLWLLAWSVAAQSQETVTFSPEQLRADLASIESALNRTHPDVLHSVDPAVLARAFLTTRRVTPRMHSHRIVFANDSLIKDAAVDLRVRKYRRLVSCAAGRSVS